MRKVKFVPGEYYHIFSRTIFNIPEFKENRNIKRLTQAFLAANSKESDKIFQILRNNENISIEKIIKIVNQREKLVDILCYVVMPDHYHLLLKERRKNGITEFVRKCNISIAKYINIKKERKGSLFESRFNSKHIDDNKYLLHLSLYIHLNPLDFLVNKNWRNHKLRDWSDAKRKLLNYPWSSLKSFLDKNNKDPIITGTDIILEQFPNANDYEFFLKDWSGESLDAIEDFI
ncbi:MAG: hypothetical protein A3H02_03195 [Candidatus Niyogibacteria bacterium RIFCSPLOWO2_12_FULL_41_13]|uniref:Transposase IS200-like domain-containing protein n=1 Tax=Candidatus Niyogibacteria bacterium RIFCSPLOWO2_12_FULL_41_13 TaxID=1801726 RepID=A0A1G2F311_9BACT|nr:MAG: hypothetical protein A3H02_03195 [Candidatus Niyogibacteria bacterium RIFCSPLOWO2_12_FULL_41_13]